MPHGRFHNSWPHATHGILDVLRWKLGRLPKETPRIAGAPDTPAPRIALDRASIATPPATGWRIVWLGHASFLIQGAGASLLIDPVFSEHCFPLALPGLRRRVAPPCTLQDLPPIDAVLLTHSHYDHLDLPTLEQLGHQTPLFVPAGHAAWLQRKGFQHTTEVRWHDRVQIRAGIQLTATPAQHFTARSPWDRDQAHWCGWLIEGAGCKLWHAGDSGYCPAFAELGERHGPIDLGLIPIGAYQPQSIMQPMHMNPEEAVQVFQETRCRRAIAMHWGTFKLTDEPLGEPPLWLRSAMNAKQMPAESFQTLSIGTIYQCLE